MIYYENRSLFIHIPRTSGLSVAKAVLTQEDPELSVNVVLGRGPEPFRRHSQAHVLQTALPDWNSPWLKKFTVIRNPWRICESTYRQFRLVQRRLEEGEMGWMDPELQKAVTEEAKQSFETFVFSHFEYLRKGFFAHWALEWDTYRDLGVEAVRFEELDQRWPRICKWLQLPETTPRPWVNAGVPSATAWTEPMQNFLRERCQLDFELFGYPRHP